jgi:hypothetical protein
MNHPVLRGDDRIYRHQVPVDDQWHELELHGNPLAVAARNPAIVEFWARFSPGVAGMKRQFRVIGTGQPTPDNAVTYWGTTVASPQLVWHLVERGPTT